MKGLPSPSEIMRRGTSEGEWLVPVEIVLACSNSAFVRMVYERARRGDWYKPTAAVIARGKRFFATIEFRDANFHGVFLPMEAWTLENSPEVDEALVRLAVRHDRQGGPWS